MMEDMDWSADDNKGVIYRDRAPTADDYREAIADLQNALVAIETGDESKGCAVCEDSGHGVRHCHHNPLEAARAWVREQGKWRCFHCGYVALTEADALAHFGENEFQTAACLATTRAELAAMRQWRDAVDDALTSLMTTTDSFPDARAAVRWLIEQEQQIALDPAVSEDARKLIAARDATIIQLGENAAKAAGEYAENMAAKDAEIARLREALENIAAETSAEPDAGENYRWDDREGALDFAYSTARAALTEPTDG